MTRTLRRWWPLLAVWVPLHASADPTEPNTLVNPLEPASKCRTCHAYPNAADKAADPPYSPWAWQGSMMANAARDPVFWAGVAIAHQDDPGTTSECVRCHAPRAFLEGRGDAIAITDLDPADLDGVECDLCHRAFDDGVTPPGNAHYAVDDTLLMAAVPKRGQFDYQADTPTHSWLQDAFTGSSELCGVCHDVTTPRERVDDDGTPMGMPFNEQRTYSEWANSAFSRPAPDGETCQDCHMPAVADVGACADFDVDGLKHATGVRRHDLVGANRFVTELLKQLYGDAGSGEVDDVFFDTSLARIDELLGQAATVEVEAPATVDVGTGLDALTVTVTNHTGHKLPTGYSEGRVMWLEVVARYAGRELWTSGKYVEGVGPEQDDQLRTYQGVAEDFADGTQLHLLRNNHWVEDTRIPPEGLRQDVETDPVGDRYTLQADDTWPNHDTVAYVFAGRDDVEDATPDDANDDVLEVGVRLLYLINTPDYIAFLAEENMTNAAGTDLLGLFEDAGGAAPLVLAEHTVEIPLRGLDTGGDTSGSGGSSGSGSTTPGSSDDGGPSSATEGTSGASAGSSGNGGCGCRTTHRSTPLLALAWLLACFARGRRPSATAARRGSRRGPRPRALRPPARRRRSGCG